MNPDPVPNDLLVPLFRDARDMLILTWAGVRAPSAAALDTAAALGRDIHKAEKELTERLVAVSDEAAPLRLVPAHVERIGDAIEGLIRACQLMEAEGTTFTPRGMREVNALFERAVELLECAGDLTLTGNRVLARHVELESVRFQDLATEYARAHEERLVEGACRPASSSAYLGILDYLREITRHARLIAGRIATRPVPGGSPFFRV
jgi:Na+/phosphate symporter